MDDLISRQAAIDALNQMKIYRQRNSDRWVISDCLNKIVNLPSAQSEQKTGRWIKIRMYGKDFGYKCSKCGIVYGHGYNYCPNCGARMEADDEID